MGVAATQGLCLLPAELRCRLLAGVSAERALQKLRRKIIQMAESAVLLRSTSLGGGSDVGAMFRAARDDE